MMRAKSTGNLRLLPLLLAALVLTAGLAVWAAWPAAPAWAQAQDDDAPAVDNLRCVAETDRVAFLWEAPEWSGGEAYAYDYELTLPDGTEESQRLGKGPSPTSLVLHTGSYQTGQEARFKVKAVFRTDGGGDVVGAEAELACWVGGEPAPANAAPTVASAIGDVTIVNESGTSQVSLSGVFEDADSDSLTITAGSSNTAVATASVSSDNATLTVSAKARGTATITATADDGNGGTVSDQFTVTVKAAPVVASALADVSGLEVGDSQEVSLSGVFSDADGDTLTITAGSSSDAVATATVASDQSKLTLAGVAQGTATITVTAQDSDGNRVSDSFDVSVVPAPAQPNNPPTVAGAIADATIVHESGTRSVSLSGVFSDADNDSLTITADSSNTAVATASVSSDNATLTVSAKARGTATVTVTANDGNGGTVADQFTVTVKAAPTVSVALADLSGLEAGATRDVSLSGAFLDADNDSLTVTATSSDEAKATVTVASDHSKLTLAGVAEGTATITITARDSDGNTVSDTFDVAVSPAPQQQTLSSDATLSALVLLDRDGSAMTLRPAFDPQVKEYGATVTGNGQARVRPTANNAGATITVDGKTVQGGQASAGVLLGINTPKRFAVVVTAADGATTREYGVTATYAPRAALSGLTISPGTLHPPFSSNEKSLRAWVPYSVEEVKVTPTNRHAKGTITVNGKTVASGQASQAIPLTVGETVITVKITAPDDYTSSAHTITVARASEAASSDATLSGLAVYQATSKQPESGNRVPYTGSAYAMTPAFQSGVYDYRVRVPDLVPEGMRYLYVTTVATTTAPGAKSIAVSGIPSNEEARPPRGNVVTGEASGPWRTRIGHDLIKIDVTSLDGQNTQTYRVVVEKGTVDAPKGAALTPGDGSLTLAWEGSSQRTAPSSYLARWRKAGETAWLNQAADGQPGYKVGFGPSERDWTAADGFFASLENRAVASGGGSHKITGLDNGTEYEVQLRGTRGGNIVNLNLNWLQSDWVTVKGTPGQPAATALTITPGSPTREYGGTDDLSYTVSGLIDGDDAADVVTGALARAAGNDAGSYAINLGTLAIASAYAQKYALPSAPAVTTYTITPRAITAVGGVTVNGRPADGTTTATFDTGAATGTGVLAAELADFRAGGLRVSGAFPAATAGTHSLSVTYSLQDRGSFKAGNYTLSSTSATLRGELTQAAPPAVCGLVSRSDYDADGDGLIEVCTVAQLNAIRWDTDGDGSANAAFPGAAPGMGCPPTGCQGYELAADLDFDTNGNGRADAGDEYWNDGWGWMPIGMGTPQFSAVFDGNGFAISNLFIDRNTKHNHLGLFQHNRGTIRNLRLENVDVSSAGDMIGALAGDSHGAISNVSVTGSVTGDHDVGGLVGENHGAVSHSSADATVRSVAGDSPADTGGLVGENFGSIAHSHSAGAVSGKFAVGGLVGKQFEGGHVRFSHSSASVTGTHAAADGGFDVGGLVGDNRGFISASYATGTVSGRADRTGGLVGFNRGSIVAAYAWGAVSSSGNNVAGLVGVTRGPVRAAYAVGAVSAGSRPGGLVGLQENLQGGLWVTDSYWDSQTTGQSLALNGTPRTTAELQQPTGYTGIYAAWSRLDLNGDGTPDDVWDFGAADQYPTLKTDLVLAWRPATGGPQPTTHRNRVNVTAYANLKVAGAGDLEVRTLALPQGAAIEPQFSSGHHSYRLTVPHDVDHLVFGGGFSSKETSGVDAFAVLIAGLEGEYAKASDRGNYDVTTVNRVIIATSQRDDNTNRIALAKGEETVIEIAIHKTRPGHRHDITRKNEHVAKVVYTLTVTRAPAPTTAANRVNVTAYADLRVAGADDLEVRTLELPPGAAIEPQFSSGHHSYRVTVPHDVDHLVFGGSLEYDTNRSPAHATLMAHLQGEYDKARDQNPQDRIRTLERIIIATPGRSAGDNRIELAQGEETAIEVGVYKTRTSDRSDIRYQNEHVSKKLYTLTVTRAPAPTTDANRVNVTAYANLTNREVDPDNLAVTALALPPGAAIEPQFRPGHYNYRVTVPREVDHLVFAGSVSSTPSAGSERPGERTGFAILVAALPGEYDAARFYGGRRTVRDRSVIANIVGANGANRIALSQDGATTINIGVMKTRPGHQNDLSERHHLYERVASAIYTLTVTRAPADTGDAQQTTNRAPAVSAPLDDVTISRGIGTRTVSLSGVFTDADHDALTITAASSDKHVATVSVAADYSTLTLTVEEESLMATITVTADDGNGGIVSDTFTVTVTATPGVSDVSPGSNAIIVNQSGTRRFYLYHYVREADRDTINATSSNEAVATVSVADDRYSTLTVTAKARGTAKITITSNRTHGVATLRFTVTVKAAPTVASPLADVSGLEVGGTQEVSLSGAFTDADGDALTITATSSDDAKATATVASDYSRLTLAGVAVGTATITVTARDSDGNTVSDAFDAPVARKYNALIAQMYDWRNDPQWVSHKSHTDKWDRTLLAFGETVQDQTLTAMTAAEAQAFADTPNGQRWVPVAAALWEIEGGRPGG